MIFTYYMGVELVAVIFLISYNLKETIRIMKKITITTLCALCLFGAFAATVAQSNVKEDQTSELALSRKRVPVRF